MTTKKSTNTLFGRWSAFLLFMMAITALLILCAPGVAARAQADDHIGSITSNGNTATYETYADLKQALENLENEDVTVEMLDNWTRTEALVIPPNSRVTLNMNGHVLDRALSALDPCEGVNHGEAITVMSGAVLTINGGSRDADHKHITRVYDKLEISNGSAPAGRLDVEGGLITGGYTLENGGGINMVGSGCTITLNDVTIAGCRAACGGGVHLGKEGILDMNNSTITGCYANSYGGGVDVDDESGIVDLANFSHIDGNFAHDSGGGVALKSQYARVAGGGVEDGKSTVSNNQSSNQGGGILVSGSNNEVDWLTMTGNQSTDGGALYVRSDGATLTNLSIGNTASSQDGANQATAHGGGIYLAAENTSSSSYAGDSLLRDCVIMGNTAQVGGGVYIDDYSASRNDRRRVISGKTVIKDNTGSDYLNNLCIESDAWHHNRECFNLSEDSEVWVGFKEAQFGTSASNVVNDEVCDKYLHSDQPSWYFHFSVNERYIYRDGDASTTTLLPITPGNANNAANRENLENDSTIAGKIGTVYAGGASGGNGDTYDKIRGFYMHEVDKELTAFYYSDGLFYASPYTYNEHLGSLSLAFAFAGGNLVKSETADANGNVYYNKHAAARQFLADIGCPDQNIYVNDNMLVKPGTESVGVTIGSKELSTTNGKTGDILVAAAVRGFGYEAEWVSNVTLDSAAQMANKGKEAKGFSSAADQVTDRIEYYLKKYGLEDEYRAGKVKFWITGYSRAGATANLTSKRLIDKIAKDCTGDKKSEVFGYTCEAPKGGTDDAEVSGSNYLCIHNLVNAVDIVPYVAPGEMGFKRYGVDHYIPGTEVNTVKRTKKSVIRGGANGVSTVTTYADNEITWTKTDQYNTQKEKMLKQLKAMDHSRTFNDYFHPMALDYIHYTFPFTIEKMKRYKNGSYDNNHIEDFVADFVRFLQEGSDSSNPSHWSQALNSRDRWAIENVQFKLKHPPIQKVARDLMSINHGVNGTTKADMDLFISRAKKIADLIPKIGTKKSPGFDDIYFKVIKGWHKQGKLAKSRIIQQLKNYLAKTGALDALSAKDKSNIQKDFATLADFAFRFLEADRDRHPVYNSSLQWAKGSNETVMYMATFLEHATFIGECHTPQVNIAWARSYDSWYENEPNSEYRLEAQSYAVDAPEAYGTINGARTSIEPTDSQATRLPGDQKIFLANDNIVGEAIYYDLFDMTNGEKRLYANQLYRGGIDLQLGKATSKTYEIRTYDMSYGVKSAIVKYRVTLFNPRHEVVVVDQIEEDAGDSQVTGQSLSAGIAPSGLTAGAPATLSPNSAENVTTRTQERTFTFAEGQETFVQANIPSSRFFKSWKVEVLDSTGSIVKSDDAQALLSDQRTSSAAGFTMPQAGTEDYPEGYQLRFIADYGTRIETVQMVDVENVTPVAGTSLSPTINVSFDGKPAKPYSATWTYAIGDSDSKQAVPAPDIAYGDTVYTASILIEQKPDEDIAFAPSVNVSSDAGTVKNAIVQRDAADGSITIAVEFGETGFDEEHVRPDALRNLNIKVVDLNMPEAEPSVAERKVCPGHVIKLAAPEVPDEQFVNWDLGNSRITPAGESSLEDEIITVAVPDDITDGTSIEARYKPIVQDITVNLYDDENNRFKPEGDGTGPSRAEMIVKITNDYEIHPDNLEVSWTPGLPESGTYAYLTDYAGTVKIVPDAEGKVRAKVRGADDSAYQEIKLAIVPAETLAMTFNGSTENASFDFDARAARKVFPKTTYTLGAVSQPDIIEGVAYADGNSEDKIRSLLPDTTKIMTTSGLELDADVKWETIILQDGGEQYAAMTWTAYGEVKLPETVKNPGNAVRLNMFLVVYVDEAASALAPSASLDPGTYLYNQVTTLSVDEENGTVYYTTDGTDPTTSQTRKKYEGEEIYISRAGAVQNEMNSDEEGTETPTGRKAFVIKAYTTAPGKPSSDVTELEYVFDDVPVPEAVQLDYSTDEQIGVEASPFYALQIVDEDGNPVNNGAGDTQGVYIDEMGNAVAATSAKSGTYWVKATLGQAVEGAEPYRWAANDDGTRPEGPQIVKLTISEKYNEITVNAEPTYGGTVTGGGKYLDDEEVTVTATPDTGFTFVNWTKDGQVVSTDPSYTFKAADVAGATGSCSFTANFDWVITVRWVDGNGNELTKNLDVSMMGTVDFEKLNYQGPDPTKAADARYTYVFSSWDGGTLDGSYTTLTYTPQFDKILNRYKVSFVNDDGTVLKDAVEYDYGTPAADIELPPEPSKAATAQYTYAFSGWSPKIADVTGDVVYTATYTQTAASEDEPLVEATYAPLKLKSGKTTKTSIKLSWSKVAGAKSYVIYGGQGGKGQATLELKTTSGKSAKIKMVGKKLAKGKPYKFAVTALDGNGKTIGKSQTVYVYTKGGKYGNPKSVTVKKKILSKAKKLKKGKTLKLKAKMKKTGNKKLKKLAAMRYESSNPAVATVSKKGVVKAMGKGRCYVFAYAQNGVAKKVKVVVK